MVMFGDRMRVDVDKLSYNWQKNKENVTAKK